MLENKILDLEISNSNSMKISSDDSNSVDIINDFYVDWGIIMEVAMQMCSLLNKLQMCLLFNVKKNK